MQPMGPKRTKDQAGLLAATAAMNKRVKELTEYSVRKAETLKNMERAVFFKSAAMRGTPAAQAFWDRTAARMAAKIEEKDKHARMRQEEVAAERARDDAEARRVPVIAYAEADALARRATAKTARLAARAATAAAAARSPAGRALHDDDLSFTDQDGLKRRPRLPAFAAAGASGSRSSGGGQERAGGRRGGSGGHRGEGGGREGSGGGREEGGGCRGEVVEGAGGAQPPLVKVLVVHAVRTCHDMAEAALPRRMSVVRIPAELLVLPCRTEADCIPPRHRVLTPAPAPGQSQVGLQKR